MPSYIRFHVFVRPHGQDEPIALTLRWNDFVKWEENTGRSFAELESAMATVISDAAYVTAKRKGLFTGTFDEFLSGDLGFETEDEVVTDPTRPGRSTGSSSSLPSPPESVPANGPVPVSVP